MSDKKLLVAYKVEGDAAKIVFASHPDVAEKSEVKIPERGLAVLLQDDNSMAELNDGLVEGLKLIKAGVIKEFVVNLENLTAAIDNATKTVALLSAYLEVALDGEEIDDVDDAE